MKLMTETFSKSSRISFKMSLKIQCYFAIFYIYVYIHRVLFGPVKPELWVIPSGPKKIFKSEHLNFLDKELNITDITEQPVFVFS